MIFNERNGEAELHAAIDQVMQPPQPTNTRTVLSVQEILAADDLPLEFVPVPEWAPKDVPAADRTTYGVYARGLSAIDRDEFEVEMTQHRTDSAEFNYKNLRARLCGRCITDADGKRLFTDNEIAALGRKSGIALQRVFAVAQRLCGMTPTDIAELSGINEATS